MCTNQHKWSTKITVGFIWFGQLRQQLDETAWDNEKFNYVESKGWLDRTFYCRGSYDTIYALYKQFRGFATRPVKCK